MYSKSAQAAGSDISVPTTPQSAQCGWAFYNNAIEMYAVSNRYT